MRDIKCAWCKNLRTDCITPTKYRCIYNFYVSTHNVNSTHRCTVFKLDPDKALLALAQETRDD